MTATAVVYGATGYMGRLTATALRDAGLDVVAAGRDPAALNALSAALGVPGRAAPLDDPMALDRLLDGTGVVVNCAGPFARTQGPLVDACLRTGTHYLDLAGEVPEFQALQRRDAAARAAGVLLLPGAGFGVVPTDCLAAHLAARLPGATRLELAFQTVGGLSRGTARTLFGDLHRPGVARRGGRLVPRRAAAASRRLDLGAGPVTVVTNPWRADLVTAAHTTGIGDVDTFFAVPGPVAAAMRAGPRLRPLLDSRPWRRLLDAAIGRLPEGPDERTLATGRSLVWGEVTDAAGGRAAARLEGPEAYRFSALTAALLAGRVLAADPPVGFATPAGAFGADLVLAVPGVRRVDLPG